MSKLNKINEYFKDLQKSDTSSYKKRINSFENIVDAIEKGDEQALRSTLKASISAFGSGMSKRYAKLLQDLQLNLDRDGIKSLQKELSNIDFVFRNFSHDKEEIPLTTKFTSSTVQSSKDDLSFSEESSGEFRKPTLHQQEFVTKLIKSMIEQLDNYQTHSQGELENARKQTTMDDTHSESLVDMGVEFTKSKIMQGLFESGLKIDLKLTREKHDLAGSLKNNLYEALEGVDEIPSERIAASAAFFLLDALKQNENLAKDSKFGTKGNLGKIIQSSLESINKYYPEGMKIAVKHFDEYRSSILSKT